MKYAIIAVCLVMSACAQPAPEIKVVADTFCQSAKKRTWDVGDTLETIQETIRINAGIDRACGVPKATKVAAK